MFTPRHLTGQVEIVTFQEGSSHSCHLSPLSIVYHRSGWFFWKEEKNANSLRLLRSNGKRSTLWTILTDEREIHPKVPRRGIDKIYPTSEDSLVFECDLGNFELSSMTITDLKVGPLAEIIADRPMNGGGEIFASCVQAAQKDEQRFSIVEHNLFPFAAASRSK